MGVQNRKKYDSDFKKNAVLLTEELPTYDGLRFAFVPFG